MDGPVRTYLELLGLLWPSAAYEAISQSPLPNYDGRCLESNPKVYINLRNKYNFS